MIKKITRKTSKQIKEFSLLFKKHLAEFIIGAFSFVAALLWRDAIQELINVYRKAIENFIPFQGILITKFLIAIFVSIFAIFAIVLISKFLKD